jgi:hypothetical protein
MSAHVTGLDIEVFVDALPDLDPVIGCERTENGWRGLTQQGEVLEVRGANGHAIAIPSEIVVAQNGKPIGRRAIHADLAVDIDAYLAHFNAVVAHYRDNRVNEALVESDAALKFAPTLRAKFNRSMVLLASGRWQEGLAEYWQCEQHLPFMRPRAQAALAVGIPVWKGEDLRDKRLLLLHAHGFGDTIQMLRYVPKLWRMGANISLDVPPELRRIAEGFASVVNPTDRPPDYFCPILHLLHWLKIAPDNVDGRAYIVAERPKITEVGGKRIGIAWSIGKPSDGDYPREIPLAELVEALGDAELYSVQAQSAQQARAFGIGTPTFTDFADCASFMLQMDAIVSVDTAALHLAGAIGHPRVYGLLSHWSSWRWLAPWYDNVKLCRQAKADDWASALALINDR